MAVWPFVPQDEPTEALAWLTDIIRAYDGEQRAKLTDAPRSAFEFDYLLDSQQLARARAMVDGAGHLPWDLPIWTDVLAIGTWPAGQSSVEIDADYADFRIGEQALLFQSDTVWEVVDVVDGGGGAVDVETAAPAAVTYSPAWIVPLRTAYLTKGLRAGRKHPVLASVRASWAIVGGVDLSAATDFSTHRTYPVMTDRAVVLSGYDESAEWDLDIIDNGIAEPYVDTEIGAAAVKSSVAWSLPTKASLWRLRQWLHTCKGRWHAFWVPTWSADLVLRSNISSAHTVIHVEAIGYPDYYTGTDIMILKTSGSIVCLRVLSGATESGGEVLTLSAAVGQNITVAEIDRICFLSLMRFASDRFEFKHGPGSATLITSVERVPVP